MANFDMETKLEFVLRLADDALIISQRLGEWCGHGPILEQDIAVTNAALDHMGRARSLYQYAAELFNKLSPEGKAACFTSIALQNLVANGRELDEDNLAYLRDGWDFRNVLLSEQPNVDWAYTIVRGFFLDAFNYFYFQWLSQSADSALAAVAEKSLKEVTYHLRWSSEWVIRLGDGTDESHKRVQAAVTDLWAFTGELFAPAIYELEAQEHGIGPRLDDLKLQWMACVERVFGEASIDLPKGTWMQHGGKEGRHTEQLGYMLAELQFMQRTYPAMEW